ncbi:MAG: acyl-CoA dehydrogenase [Pseudomonadota bacterium]
MSYTAPIREMQGVLQDVIGIGHYAEMERYADATPETVEAILSEAAKLAQDVISPLQRSGDLHPAYLENGVVRTSPGYAEGYRALQEGGWIGMCANPEFGGMGLPNTLSIAVQEMLNATCVSLTLCPLLSQGQIDALEAHASEEIKALYLPKLVSGEWTGTMNLTEPQAGSDVGALTAKALPNEDGTCTISGQKIYISWGDHDLAENVIHLVLARLPDAPPGSRGVSLFLVPKFLPNADGTPGARNAVSVVSLEHKTGLHGSPTCVMEFAEAKGWQIGGPHQGLAAMFTMMNNARLGVGIEGVGVAEGAYQHAYAYARDRVQGKTMAPGGTGTILDHADVRRMLMTMKTLTGAARAICLDTAFSLDMARDAEGLYWRDRAAFLTPIAKAFGTDIGSEVADMGVQVHGGMGYVEETGAAQYLRDVRVTRIYEGTNGIQAMDLVGRKMMDGGAAAEALLDEVEATARAAREQFPELGDILQDQGESLATATRWMVAAQMNDRFAGGVPYLRAFALVLGGHYALKALLAQPEDAARKAQAVFFIRQIVPGVAVLCAAATEGAAPLYALDAEAFAPAQ